MEQRSQPGSPSRLRLVSWRPDEAAARAAQLRAAGYEVLWEGLDPRTLRQIRDDLPDAVVIDLDRLPSQGRDLGLAVRYYKATRQLPLVFLGGETAKVDRVRSLITDAVYAGWDEAPQVIAAAIANPPPVTSMPQSLLDGYSGAPVYTKLGIKPGWIVLVVEPPPFLGPPGVQAPPLPELGELPPGATLTHNPAAPAGVILWPVRTLAELESGLPTWVPRAADAKLWIAWPRKSATWTPAVNQNNIRAAGLAAGLVDYKIAHIDDVWNAGAFAVRKPKKE